MERTMREYSWLVHSYFIGYITDEAGAFFFPLLGGVYVVHDNISIIFLDTEYVSISTIICDPALLIDTW